MATFPQGRADAEQPCQIKQVFIESLSI